MFSTFLIFFRMLSKNVKPSGDYHQKKERGPSRQVVKPHNFSIRKCALAFLLMLLTPCCLLLLFLYTSISRFNKDFK